MGEIWEIHHAANGPDLIERGYTVRALVQWWGNMGETARPYLWKERPEDTGYKESWGDPRKPRKDLRQDRSQERNETPVIKKIEGTRIVRAPVSPVSDQHTGGKAGG